MNAVKLDQERACAVSLAGWLRPPRCSRAERGVGTGRMRGARLGEAACPDDSSPYASGIRYDVADS